MKKLPTISVFAVCVLACTLTLLAKPKPTDFQNIWEVVVVDVNAMTNSLPASQWESLFTTGKVKESALNTCRFSLDRRWVLLKFEKNSTSATAWFDAKGVPYTKYDYHGFQQYIQFGTNWYDPS